MKTISIFTGCLLCALLLFTGCVEDLIQVAQPTVTITGTYELHKGEPLGTLTPEGSAQYNGQSVEGTLAWKDASVTYTETGEQQVAWIFTPADEALYAKAEGTARVTVVRNVYVCGTSFNTENNTLTGRIWKNGNLLYTPHYARYVPVDISVSEGNVYTYGYHIHENGNNISMVWKNDKLLYTLTDGNKESYLGSLLISEGNIYVCGTEANENGILVAKIWKNGNLLYTLTDGRYDGVPYDMRISEGNIYICGYEKNEYNQEVAKIWKNSNLLYPLSNGDFHTRTISLQIVDGTIYTAGYEYTLPEGRNMTKVWKDNTLLYERKASEWDSSMTVSDGCIYLFVTDTSPTSGGVLKVLKNGKELYTLTDGTLYAQNFAIMVSDDDVYTCGVEFQQGSLMTKAAMVWKNNDLLYTQPEGSLFFDLFID